MRRDEMSAMWTLL